MADEEYWVQWMEKQAGRLVDIQRRVRLRSGLAEQWIGWDERDNVVVGSATAVSRPVLRLRQVEGGWEVERLPSETPVTVDEQPLLPGVPLLLEAQTTITLAGRFYLQVRGHFAQPPPSVSLTEAARPALPPLPPPVQASPLSWPPGVSTSSSRYVDYLPAIYHTPFMHRFLAAFEAIMTPIEWTIDHFGWYLDPQTAPAEFLPWLGEWFEIAFDEAWTETQQRRFLAAAAELFAWRGTKRALRQTLQIVLNLPSDNEVVIDDDPQRHGPGVFAVHIPCPPQAIDRTALERVIAANKPAHTRYVLHFAPEQGY